MNILAAIVCITNIGFTAAFDTDTKCPSWVAYDLGPSDVIRAKRADIQFSPDPRIPDTDLNSDYLGSGYDRGHLAPAADFNWSTNALRETYYFSNICPQLPHVNRDEWLENEREVRRLAASGTVHVVTFPADFTTNRIGRVAVPGSFYKVAYGWFGVRIWCVLNSSTNCHGKN